MKQKILSALSLLFGLMFINAGLNKFFNYMPVPDDLPENTVKMMNAFMEISWLMPLVGLTEIVAGILFIIPKTRALGAIAIFPVLIGILLTHLITAPSGLPIALILLGISLWVMFENKHKYLAMVK